LEKYNVTAIGNAIVDVLAKCDDEFLGKKDITKGAMNLVDEKRSNDLLNSIDQPQIISGGSAANTAVGLSMLGSKSNFIGKVKDDELGNLFINDIRNAGVSFKTNPTSSGPNTASSIIFTTPDAERSMNTYLGACVDLGPEDIDIDSIKNSEISYLEGYLFDPPKAKEAFYKVAEIAKNNKRLVALTLSDSFCVERHRNDFMSFINENVDILFCNEDEAKSLFECNTDAAKRHFEELKLEVAITLGSKGSTILRNGRWYNIEPKVLGKVEDTNGAGDLFASGYLHGRTSGKPPELCGEYASIVSGEIISHIGARPQKDLKKLIVT
tara:strand:- start:330 stop:1304 length:975 start_codon:yes stop_codon:yes gene_type:complete